jgi:hypothetical protein
MKARFKLIWAGLLAIAGTSASGLPSARAQMAMPGAGGRSLGGYGASAISSYYGGGSTVYVPYSGNSHGFVPYSGGNGGGLGVQRIPRRLSSTTIGGAMMAQTPIGGASLSGGMGGSTRGGMGMGPGTGPRGLVPFGYEGGVGMGGGMSGMPMTRQGGTRQSATGPGFGYPFRMPPSLTGAGTSMSMP